MIMHNSIQLCYKMLFILVLTLFQNLEPVRSGKPCIYGVVLSRYEATQEMLGRPECAVANKWTHEQPGYKMTCFLCSDGRFIVISQDDLLLQAASVQICDFSLLSLSIDILPANQLTAGTQHGIQYGSAFGGCKRVDYSVTDGKIITREAEKCIKITLSQVFKGIFKGYNKGWILVENGQPVNIKENHVVIALYDAADDLLKQPNCAIEKRWVYMYQVYMMNCYLCTNRPRFIVINKDGLFVQAADVQTCQTSVVPPSVDVVPSVIRDKDVQYSLQYGMTSGECKRIDYNVVDGQVTRQTEKPCFPKDKVSKKTTFKGYETVWKHDPGQQLLFDKYTFTK